MDATFTLHALWTRLTDIETLIFDAKSTNSDAGWNGSGQGEVVVETVAPDTMLFHEKGQWKPAAAKELGFTNVYRWTLLTESNSLRLEHLRFGNEHPVYLFDLQQTDRATWKSIEPHVCREDFYEAMLHLDGEVVSLHWTIKGPVKNEDIHYVYR